MQHSLPPNPNDSIIYNPEKLMEIYLAGGCFWGTQAFMARIPGVAETLCGYANGHTENPTYEQVCYDGTGHAEAVRVLYDPDRLPLEELLLYFFQTINPTLKNRQGGDVGIQYRTGIYYTDERDLPIIQNFIQERQAAYQKPIVTEVEPLQGFYPAEAYHQNYLEKHPGGYCHVNLGLLPKA